MTDRPIIFSAPMVRALLEGRKTQTRRVLKPSPGAQSKWLTMELLNKSPSCYLCEFEGRLGAQMQHPMAGTEGVDAMSPLTWVALPYAIGDRLWVREAWAHDATDLDECRASKEDAMNGGRGDYGPYYRATEVAPETLAWRSPIHMPRWASRLTLIVTDVRVQRLQEISDADALDEGVSLRGEPTARSAFRSLWSSIHGPDAWDANPWVVALTFTVEQRNIDA